MTKKIDIDDIASNSISLEGSLVGLQKFSNEFFTSIDHIKLSDLSALNGLIDSITALASKNTADIQEYSMTIK
ncbi:hypothetical protein [Vagococcus fluvialis]|uniref:hypothetical protein n=1 Tax=Vagococcus fluvialis TaxID=2738 RepID=UPI003B216E46